MTITVCNGKGGAGKTTLAVLLALAFAQRGASPRVLDHDSQKTATRWLESLGLPFAADEAIPAGDPVLIDTPPLLSSPALHAAIRRSDLVLLVSSASPADLWSSQNTAAVIREHLPPTARACIVFNQIQKNAILTRDLPQLADQIGLPALASHLARRQVYQHAALLGWRALDLPARVDLLNLVEEIAPAIAP